MVSSQSEHAFSCEVSTKTEASVSDSTYLGSNGLKRLFANETNGLNWDHLKAENYDHVEKLALTMQSPYNEPGDNMGNIYKGWFVAPATTNYRFYLACDDYCDLNLGTTNMVDTDPTKIAENIGGINYRDWWETGNYEQMRISDWISLVEGESYYI